MSDTQEQERDSGHVDQAGEIRSEASSEVLQAWSPAVGTRASEQGEAGLSQGPAGGHVADSAVGQSPH